MKYLLFASLMLVACSHGSAQIEATPFPGFKSISLPKPGGVEAQPKVTAELISEVTAIAPGKPFVVAWKFVHEEPWHTYWSHAGGPAKPTKVTWKLPPDFTAGEILYPTPMRIVVQSEDDLKAQRSSYVYQGTNYLFVEIDPSNNLKIGENITIEAKINYQFCTTECSEATSVHRLTLQVAAVPVPNTESAPLLVEFRKAHFPRPLPATWQVTAERVGSEVTLKLLGADLPKGLTEFYPKAKQIKSKESYVTRQGEGSISIELPLDVGEERDNPLKVLPGLIVVAGSDAFAPPVAYELGVPITVGTASDVSNMTLSYTLLLAFLGGLILNLMPCVFPVIGLKIMGFVRQAGQDRKKILLHGLMFSAGVLVCFWALSGTLLFLRSRGEQVGWGFQLQSPWVVYGLMILMFAFALNMFGVFEIGTSAVGVGQDLTAKQGLSGTFFSGLLAVVVATPCSAPFLAPALGAALTLPPVSFFSVFSMVGVGLALPYLLLSAFPGLLKKLPKPGAWMEAFKQIMSFLLFMTAGYLLWVYGGLTAPTNESNQLYAILGLGVIGLGAYVYGRWCTPVHAGKTRAIGGLLALGMVVGGIYMGTPTKDALKWEVWTQERVDELREQGVPVYIDFTAKWCATCQTNKLSYKSKEILRLVDEKKIVLLKADWTDDNPKITEVLAGYGRSAIPVNVLYIPGQEEPEILPNLLTTDIVLGYWNKVPAPPAK